MRERGTRTSNDERRPHAVRDCLTNRVALLQSFRHCFCWKPDCRSGETASLVVAMQKQGWYNHRYRHEDILHQDKRA